VEGNVLPHHLLATVLRARHLHTPPHHKDRQPQMLPGWNAKACNLPSMRYSLGSKAQPEAMSFHSLKLWLMGVKSIAHRNHYKRKPR
jgi:hypothetical protein